MAAKPLRRRRALAPLLYAPRPDAHPTESHIREESLREYEPGVSPTPDAQRLTPTPPDISAASEEELLTYLERYVAAQGFTYPPLTVRDYAISLQTRPFALLSGLSGTGKSRLTSLFAEALTGSADAQYRLLPVRPDWADSTPLLGYVNLLAAGDNGRGRFHSTPFLDFLLRAARPENAYRAYFLCLDEMNLARVEHYFAEILSAMETPTRELLLPDGRAVRLPANLFLTGTLNLDEATHSLSRKVLDRANTISFQEVALRADAPEDPADVAEPFAAEMRQALFLLARVTTVGAARAKLRQIGSGKADFAACVVETLAEANALLEPHGLHFGYRVRDEVLRYSANSFDRQGRGLLVPDSVASNLRTALDLQLLQKALPRLAGTQEQIETPVRALLSWAEKAGFDRTARRLSRLLARLQRDGFAGFEE
jgi:5-methylcytosine-specific restriction endonuclease McrBC GTP-binding regulatory subunit McrB